MIECIVTNWGVTILVAMLLSFSEYLGKTKRFKENSILDFITNFLSKIHSKGN